MSRNKNRKGTKIKNKYEEIDIEKLESRQEDLTEEELKKIVDPFSGSVYETKTIVSGTIKEVEIHPIFIKKDIPEELRIKSTPEARKNLNNKNAIKFFTRKLNSNFGLKDYWITLTYLNKLEPESYEEAKKNIGNYFRKLNRLYKKKQIEQGMNEKKLKTIKYIYVIEKGSKGNWHYHIVMNSVLSMEEVEESWKFGRRNNIRFLYPDEQHLTGLANYLTKEPRGRKRWGSSLNLKNPVITRSRTKFSKRKINDMEKDYELIRIQMEKTNPGYRFISATSKKNEINSKIYIHAIMKKID